MESSLSCQPITPSTPSCTPFNHLGALLVATDPSYTAGLSQETSHALVLLLLNLHQQSYQATTVRACAGDQF